jgi:hypothetical protein
VNRTLETWRILAAALAAVVVGASQLDPAYVPSWLFAVVGALVLLSVAVAYLAERYWRR